MAATLTTVIIDGLLGEFNHRIDFPESWDYVIIYGPNGVGKTRLLEAINGALELDTAALASVPFAKLTLSFSDGHLIEVSRVVSAFSKERAFRERRAPRSTAGTARRRPVPQRARQFEYLYKLSFQGQLIGEFPVQFEASDSILVEFLNRETSWMQIGADLWEDRSDGEVVRMDELRRRFAAQITPRDRTVIPDEVRAFVKKTRSHLIETQRLVTSPRQPTAFRDDRHFSSLPRPTVSQYSDDLRSMLTQALAANSRFSQTLDRTFPRRILQRSGEPTVETEVDIRERYVRQNELREGLSALGLIDAQPELPLPDKQLEDWERYVLATYLDDTDQKLATFGAILEKVSLLSDIVDSRFLRKHLVVNSESGITITKGNDELVPLEDLSSGEQHELILFYDLLFNVEANSVVLIDEPEISLHVVWQQRFLHDLSRVAQAASLRFIIATHSPQLIHKSWHRTVELGGDAGSWT